VTLRIAAVDTPLRLETLRRLWLEYREDIASLAERGGGCA